MLKEYSFLRLKMKLEQIKETKKGSGNHKDAKGERQIRFIFRVNKTNRGGSLPFII